MSIRDLKVIIMYLCKRPRAGVCDFRTDLKSSTDDAFIISTGNLFHKVEPRCTLGISNQLPGCVPSHVFNVFV